MAPARRAALVVLSLGLLGAAAAAVVLLRTRGEPENLRAAREALSQRDLALAAEHLDRHLTEHPDDVEARLLAARTARRRGETDSFHKHIELHRKHNGPQSARAAEFRLLEAQRGDPAEGDILLRDATADPATEASGLALEAIIEGSLATLGGRNGQMWGIPAGPSDTRVVRGLQALKLWSQSRSSPAEQVQALIWRGRLQAAAGAYTDAIADFRAALAVAPSSFDARLHLARTLMQSSPRDAAVHLEFLRFTRPGDAGVRSNLATAYRTLGRADEARGLIDELLKEQPNDSGFLLELGLVELDRDKPADAEAWLRKANGLAPRDPAINLALGRCLALLGKTDEARRFQDRQEELEIAAKRPWRMAQKP